MNAARSERSPNTSSAASKPAIKSRHSPPARGKIRRSAQPARHGISAATARIRRTRIGRAGRAIAVNVNLNVEAGGEHCLLEGDAASEDMPTDIGFPLMPACAARWWNRSFDYGPRVGCWRLLRIFQRFDIKVSILGVVRGLAQYPELTHAVRRRRA